MRVYAKADGLIYGRDSAGAEHLLSNQASGSIGLEVGDLVPYWFADLPTNRLRCDGSTHDYDDWPVLGAKFGASPGGTFNMPDLRDLPLWGAGNTATGVITGADTVDLAHGHAVSGSTNTAGSHSHTTGSSGSQAVGIVSLLGTGAPPNHTHTVSTAPGHSHSVTGTAASGLGSVDKKPRRAYAHWLMVAA